MKNTVLTSAFAGWRRWVMLFVLAGSVVACADDSDEKYGFHSKHHHGKQRPSWYKVPEKSPAN